MTRFTSSSFKKHMSRKSRKLRKARKTKKSKKTRKLNMNLQIKVHLRKEQKQKQKQKVGGDTLSRRIPPQAVIANPLEWDDKPDA